MPLKDKEARRVYHKKYMKEYLKDPERKRKHLARVARQRKKYKEGLKRLLAEFRFSGCVVCGEQNACCLQAHHLDNESKDFNVGDAFWRKTPLCKVRKELDKCACLCANCHFKVHAGIFEVRALCGAGGDASLGS